MGVTVIMGDGTVAGAQITTDFSEAKVLAKLLQLMELIALIPRKILLTCHFEHHRTTSNSVTPAQKANAIGYKGKITCFDTA